VLAVFGFLDHYFAVQCETDAVPVLGKSVAVLPIPESGKFGDYFSDAYIASVASIYM
jgi:hypothetical protein